MHDITHQLTASELVVVADVLERYMLFCQPTGDSEADIHGGWNEYLSGHHTWIRKLIAANKAQQRAAACTTTCAEPAR